MAGPGRHVRIPQTIPQPIRRALKQLDDRTAELVPFGGDPIADGAAPTALPTDLPYMFIFGKIRSDEASGSGSGSGVGSGHINDFAGAGFYDGDGDLAYSFDQVYSDRPWKGIVIPGGIHTTFNDAKTDGKDFAYPLPTASGPPEFSAGDVVVLMRAGKHWVIVGSPGSGFGSGSGENLSVTCADGTTHTFQQTGPRSVKAV